MLQDVALGDTSPWPTTRTSSARPGRGDPRARRAAEGQAGPAPQRHRVRRRRLGDPLHARAADARRRARDRVAGDHRPRGVLQRDQADAQRPPGRPARPPPSSGRCSRRYNEMNAQSSTDDWDVIIVHDPQPAAHARHVPDERARAGSGAATSTSRRRTRTTIERLVPLISEYDAAVFHLQQYVPAGIDGTGGVQHLPAGDRPAVAEEHGALARGRRLRVRPVRHRRGPAADLPGVALRPLEGPARA